MRAVTHIQYIWETLMREKNAILKKKFIKCVRQKYGLVLDRYGGYVRMNLLMACFREEGIENQPLYNY